jgi:hypothetical protein
LDGANVEVGQFGKLFLSQIPSIPLTTNIRTELDTLPIGFAVNRSISDADKRDIGVGGPNSSLPFELCNVSLKRQSQMERSECAKPATFVFSIRSA